MDDKRWPLHINCVPEVEIAGRMPSLAELLARTSQPYLGPHGHAIVQDVGLPGAVGGTKYDSGKPDLSLLPTSSLEAMARALMYGEQKYNRNNFKAGFNSNRLIAACLRHVNAWNDGEDLDPESGVDHLGHALACLAMLTECRKLGTLVDGRYKAPK